MTLPTTIARLFVGAMLGFAVGCSQDGGSGDATAKKAPTKVSKLRAPSDTTMPFETYSSEVETVSGIIPPDDDSLPAADYVQMGIPSPDRPWSGTDIARATTILAAIGTNDPAKLPRYESIRSGKIFDRTLSGTNLDGLTNTAVPVANRLQLAMMYMQSYSEIMRIYLTAYNDAHTVGDSELVEIVGAMLRGSAVTSRLLVEYEQALDPALPDYATRMEGIRMIRDDMVGTLAGSLAMLKESSVYRVSERRRLLGYMIATFPALLQGVPPPARQQIIEDIRASVNNPDLQAMRQEILNLLAAAKSVETPATPAAPAP